MAATAFLALADRIVAALAPVASGAGGVALRGRHQPLPGGHSMGIRVNSLRHALQPLDLSGRAMACTSSVLVTLLVRAAPGVDAEAALDPHLGAFWAALAAVVPAAGLAEANAATVITLDLDETDHTVAVASTVVTVTHHVAGATLAAL